LDILEIPTVVLLCLFQGLVVGLLRPRPSLKQIEQSSKKRKVPGAPQSNLNLTSVSVGISQAVRKEKKKHIRQREGEQKIKIMPQISTYGLTLTDQSFGICTYS
jgi:hypothetical protein